MRHPRRRHVLLILPLLALAACGDDSPVDDAGATLPPVETASRPTVPADRVRRPATTPTSYDVATGADDVVISVTNEGGFVPAGFAFVEPADRARHRRRPGAVDRPGRRRSSPARCCRTSCSARSRRPAVQELLADGRRARPARRRRVRGPDEHRRRRHDDRRDHRRRHDVPPRGLRPRPRARGRDATRPAQALAEFVAAAVEPAGDGRRRRARSRGAVHERAVPDPGDAGRSRRDRRRRRRADVRAVAGRCAGAPARRRRVRRGAGRRVRSAVRRRRRR